MIETESIRYTFASFLIAFAKYDSEERQSRIKK